MGNKVLLGVCGSIAAYRSVDFIRQLLDENYEVEVVLTKAAQQFVSPLSIETFVGKKCLSNDAFSPEYLGTEHIRWARWADQFLIYGATANRISQIATGDASDMLNLQLLAFDGKKVIAPAMNPVMWQNLAVQENISKLKQWGWSFVEPVAGVVACGESGVGHLAAHDSIIHCLNNASTTKLNLKTSKKVLISAGAMKSKIDPVRFMQNSSSGLTALKIAQSLKTAGAQVKFLLGEVDPLLKNSFASFDCEYFQDAAEYGVKLGANFKDCDVFISAAAVLDFEIDANNRKLEYNKSSNSVELKVRPVEDFVKKVSEQKSASQKVIAFALQTGEKQERIERALAKLNNKNCDLIVCNSAEQGMGPNSKESEYQVLFAGTSDPIDMGQMSKESFAAALTKVLLETKVL